MAYTVAQMAKLETNALQKYVILNLLRQVKLFEILPFEKVDALRNIAIRWKTLPTVAFRRINQGYTPNEGDTEQVWESVYALGGEIQFDRVFDKIGNLIQDPKRMQVDMKLTAMAITFNHYLINGDLADNPDAFEGLKKRVSLMPSRQSVYFAGASSAALDVTGAAASARAFFDKLEEMHYKCNGGDVGAFLVNENMVYGLGKAARYLQSGGASWLDVTKDSFERQILTYKGARIIDVGLKEDQSTEIITDAEVAGDAGTDATSIYAISLNMQQGIVGIQLDPIEVYDPLGGEMETLPAKLTRIEWWLGLAGFGSYGIVRGRNVEGASNWT